MRLGEVRPWNGRASANCAAEEDASAADSDSDVDSISSAEFRKALLGDSATQVKAMEGGGFSELGENDDFIVTCCIGQVACKDLSHQRPDCAENLFIMGESNLNCKHCPKCFCYVCDVKASECQFWGTGLHKSDHANAHAVATWVPLRRAAREGKMEVVRAAAATGRAGNSTAPTRSGLRARSRSKSRSRSRSRQAATKNTPSRASSRSTISLAAAARPRTRRASAAAAAEAAAGVKTTAAAAAAAAAGNTAARRKVAQAVAGAEAGATGAARCTQRVKAKRVRATACRAAPRTPGAAGPSEAQTPSRRAAAAEERPGLANPPEAMQFSAAGQGVDAEGDSPIAGDAGPTAAGPDDMEVDGAGSDVDTIGDSIADEAGAGAAALGGMEIDEAERPQGNAAAADEKAIAQTDTGGAAMAAQEGPEAGNAPQPPDPGAPPSPAFLMPCGAAEGPPAAGQPRPRPGGRRSPLRPLQPHPAASNGLQSHGARPGAMAAAVAETPGVEAPYVRTAGRRDAEWEARGGKGRRPQLDRPVIAAAAMVAAAGDGPGGNKGRKRQREERTQERLDGENAQNNEGQAEGEGPEQERGWDKKKARRGLPASWAPEGVGVFNIGWQPAAEGGARWRQGLVAGAMHAVGAVVGAACLYMISNIPQ